MSLIFGPHKVLSVRSERFTEDEFGDDLISLSNFMISMMNQLGGVGLAGVQIGVKKRIIVANISGEDVTFVNPEVRSASEELSSLEEGCLSFPLQTFFIDRPSSVTIEYQSLDGKRVVEAFEGVDSAIVQHEIDHLNGVTILDKVSRLKRDMYKRKFKKFRKKIGK